MVLSLIADKEIVLQVILTNANGEQIFLDWDEIVEEVALGKI